MNIRSKQTIQIITLTNLIPIVVVLWFSQTSTTKIPITFSILTSPYLQFGFAQVLISLVSIFVLLVWLKPNEANGNLGKKIYPWVFYLSICTVGSALLISFFWKSWGYPTFTVFETLVVNLPVIVLCISQITNVVILKKNYGERVAPTN